MGGAWGAVVGAGADAVTPTLDMTLRLEVRRQHGGFRQGYFGPDYETELRWRFLGGRLYALGTGGTLLFPEDIGTLRPGAFASGGLGVDNAR